MSACSLVILGSGNAFSTHGRASPCIWMEAEGAPPFLVDAGPTALWSLERQGLSPGDVDLLLLTHLHGDHIAGWPFLLLHAVYVTRRERPLRVLGPAGTRARLETLCAGTYPELIGEGRLPFAVEIREIEVARHAGLDAGGGIRADVVPMDHHPTSLGYRIRLAGRAVAVTGDTRWCSGLEALSRGCDLLVVECSSVRRQEYAHVSLEELREGRERLGARSIILVHVTDDVVRALGAEPIPGVRAAEDGLRLDL